jgi:hypothetical protein
MLPMLLGILKERIQPSWKKERERPGAAVKEEPSEKRLHVRME